MMGVLSIIITVGLIAGARSQDCTKNTADFETCRTKAYESYINAINAGDDNRPDWMARKSCNYLTEAVETCVDKLIGCYSEEQMEEEKDNQYKATLANIKAQIINWDSTKCPATKAHEDRVRCAKAKEDFEACKTLAYENYKKVFLTGKDDKPDWLARKSCNYLTEAVETCGNKMIGCYSQERLIQEKDNQLKDAVKEVRERVENWDSAKCQAIKDHEVRMLRTAAKSGKQNSDRQPDPTGGATTIPVSLLSFLGLTMIIKYLI